MDLKLWIFLSFVWGSNGSKNYLPDAPADETECSRRMNYLSDNYLNTRIIFPPPLFGKWVSEKCEVRTGPLYMLRSYTFYPNNTFYLLQYFYTDDSCSIITHVVSIKGHYKFTDYSSSKLYYKATRITLTLHDLPYLHSLPQKISSECPKTISEYLQMYKEYVIIEPIQKIREHNTEDENTNIPKHRKNRATYPESVSSKDAKPMTTQALSKCLSSLNISYDELSILRVQRRPAIDDKNARYELLLGSSYQEKGRRTALLRFQLPLILLNETKDCFICNLISSKTHMHVPQLIAKPLLPLFINGQWISQTCEPRSKGLHTIRSYRFNLFESTWELETKYYNNYFCSNLLMTHTTVGHFEEQGFSEVVSGATNIDFRIEKSYLTIADQGIIDTIEIHDPECGIAYYWKLNVKKEIPSKRGCSSIDLANPVLRYDIIKLDMDYYDWGNESSYILLLGDEGSVDSSQNQSRPTVFEYPLVQCDDQPQDIEFFRPITPSRALAKYSNLYFVFSIIFVTLII